MGCAVVKSGFVVVEYKELREYMSNEDIRLVQETWLMMQDDLDSIGLLIFKRLFDQNKRIKRLFKTKLSPDESSLHSGKEELVFDDDTLIVHGRIVINAMGAALECLEDFDQVSNLLIGIGERHVMYGVQADMIPLLWPPIVSTLEEKLGQHFTERVGQAWEHVFHFICSKVIEGIASLC